MGQWKERARCRSESERPEFKSSLLGYPSDFGHVSLLSSQPLFPQRPLETFHCSLAEKDNSTLPL